MECISSMLQLLSPFLQFAFHFRSLHVPFLVQTPAGPLFLHECWLLAVEVNRGVGVIPASSSFVESPRLRRGLGASLEVLIVPTRVRHSTRLSTTLSARVMSSSSLLLFPLGGFCSCSGFCTSLEEVLCGCHFSPTLLSLFLEPLPQDSSMEALFFLRFLGAGQVEDETGVALLRSLGQGDIFSIFLWVQRRRTVWSHRSCWMKVASPNDLNLFLTGMASISSSSARVEYQDNPFLRLGDSFFGSGGGLLSQQAHCHGSRDFF